MTNVSLSAGHKKVVCRFSKQTGELYIVCACVCVDGVGMVGRAEGKKINSNKAIKGMKLSGIMVVFYYIPDKLFSFTFRRSGIVEETGVTGENCRPLPSER